MAETAPLTSNSNRDTIDAIHQISLHRADEGNGTNKAASTGKLTTQLNKVTIHSKLQKYCAVAFHGTKIVGRWTVQYKTYCEMGQSKEVFISLTSRLNQ